MTREEIHALHKVFVELTGRDIPLDLQGYREHQWWDWGQQGYTEADLRLVVDYVRRGIREGKRNVGALKFVNMIGDPLRFGEDLAEAKALARQPKRDRNRDEVLRASGRSTEPKANPRTADEIMRDDAAFQAFRQLKDNL